jgi:MFS superfamily sulfate permease-like transporter
MYYANSQQLVDEITFLVSSTEPPLQWLCIEASAVDDVDYTAAEALRSIYHSLKEKGMRLVIAEVLTDMTAESHYGLAELLGAEAIYPTVNDVMAVYQTQAQPPTQMGSPHS